MLQFGEFCWRRLEARPPSQSWQRLCRISEDQIFLRWSIIYACARVGPVLSGSRLEKSFDVVKNYFARNSRFHFEISSIAVY